MIIKRKENWGFLEYDTQKHIFKVEQKRMLDEEPYVLDPIVLNVDVTFRCNMKCLHCVAMDLAAQLGGAEGSDLKLSTDLVEKINESPFMVVVITGGEPLLKDCEEILGKLIQGMENKGIIVDTNASIFPSKHILKLFRKKNVMLRVSWDIPHPGREYELRRYPDGMFSSKEDYIKSKEDFIKNMVGNDIMVGIQSVVHGQNWNNINFHNFPQKMKQLKVQRWYLQRFIPSFEKRSDKKYFLDIETYETTIPKIKKKANLMGVNCFVKMDRRHNSVFLLVKDGQLYTQSDSSPGEKVFLGKLGDKYYFDYVSSSEHSVRYYDLKKNLEYDIKHSDTDNC